MNKRTCYMCEAEATSDEHAPPKCLFPEQKDSGGIDYRINLITVPSCDLHNSAKSRDDEYLLQALAGSYTSSQVGLTQFITKVQRAYTRSPEKAAAFIRKSEPVLLKRNEGDAWEEGAEILVEGDRLDRVLESCARALYFHETSRTFSGRAQVVTGFTMYHHPEAQANAIRSIEEVTKFFADQPARGENPDIFWYKFQEGEKTALFLMHFYSSSETLVRLDKRNG